MKVIINPYNDQISRTKCGNHPNMAYKRSGSRWDKASKLFYHALPVGEIMEFGEFRKRYTGILMAVGFAPDYARDMATEGNIRNGLEHARWITIV
jgi:hypothetical protein